MRRRTMTWAGLGLGACLAAGLIYPAIAAAEDTPSPSPSASASASPTPSASPSTPDRQAREAERQAALAAALAKELGIPESKVLAALKKVEADEAAARKTERLAALKQRLDQAVKDGKLTQQQADAILKAAQNGVLPFGGHGGRGRGPR